MKFLIEFIKLPNLLPASAPRFKTSILIFQSYSSLTNRHLAWYLHFLLEIIALSNNQTDIHQYDSITNRLSVNAILARWHGPISRDDVFRDRAWDCKKGKFREQWEKMSSHEVIMNEKKRHDSFNIVWVSCVWLTQPLVGTRAALRRAGKCVFPLTMRREEK